jgi:ketosteroid isomerase-like protein
MEISVHPNEECIRRFYAAFANRDADGMAACYHPEVAFSDPAFPMLKGAEASGMWRMLVSRGKDLELTLLEASADDTGGRAIWEARYTFSQTGRPVVNRIQAAFAFRDGLIVRHVDRFPFWKWSKQALGPLGLLLGWSWPLKTMVRKKAAASLSHFMAKHSPH